jgi:hypothetical protein
MGRRAGLVGGVHVYRWPMTGLISSRGLTAWARFRVDSRGAMHVLAVSSAVIAAVYDRSDEPHHGNEDECDPHWVDLVKQHVIAAFSVASRLGARWRPPQGDWRLPVSASRAGRRSELCSTCRGDRQCRTCDHCLRRATRAAPSSRRVRRCSVRERREGVWC